jgi:rsbT antagonist protein RsbS
MTGIEDSSDVARITIQPYRGALIAAIQVDLDQRVLRQFQTDLLACVRSSDAEVVIIDLSGVEVMDGQDFEGLRQVIDMASLMGTESILCGMQPGVAAALVELDVPLDGLRTCLNLETALADLESSESSEPQVGEAEAMEDRELVNGTARDEILDPE